MIKKYFDLNTKIFNTYNFFLFYGNNEGLKNEIFDKIKPKVKVNTYEEKEILENEMNFIENLLTKSLFDETKIILIKRVTDKILKIIETFHEKNINDIILILNSSNLEKKSKLRAFFEKQKECICVPFYPDNTQTLIKYAQNFLNKNKISISSSNINLIVNKCNGDRENLLAELNKIEFFCKNGKKLTTENIVKLTNLSENHSVGQLADNCLAKNKKIIINIFNENNFSNEDSVLIIRTLLNKSKKILKLACEYEANKNIDETISLAKPPIFWKDKEITKQQIYKWNPDKIKNLIFEINELEYNVKKNINNSLNLTANFVLEQST